MTAHVLRRLLQLPLVLFAAIAVCFVVLRTTPGGPFDRARPADVEAGDAGCDPQAPLAALFLDALRGWSSLDDSGCAGRSLHEPDRSVRDVVLEGLPVTAGLGALALCVALALGMPIGMGAAVAGALRHRPGFARSLGALSSALVAVPPFVLGPLLVLVVSLTFGVLPPARWDGPSTWVLPVLTLGAAPLGHVARVSYGAVTGALVRDLVRAARTASVVKLSLVVRSALRAGVLPVVSVLGPTTGALFTSSVVVERVFDVPGLGRAFIDAASVADFNVLLGTSVAYAALVMGVNLLLDVAYGLLDPRVRGVT